MKTEKNDDLTDYPGLAQNLICQTWNQIYPKKHFWKGLIKSHQSDPNTSYTSFLTVICITLHNLVLFKSLFKKCVVLTKINPINWDVHVSSGLIMCQTLTCHRQLDTNFSQMTRPLKLESKSSNQILASPRRRLHLQILSVEIRLGKVNNQQSLLHSCPTPPNTGPSWRLSS